MDYNNYDDWFYENEDRLYIKFAEQGLDREMGFDLEGELDKEYRHYCEMQSANEENELDKEFKIERTGIYGLIFRAKCTKGDLYECLKYIDKYDKFKTPLELEVDGVLFKLGKNGLSGRVFLYRKEEEEWNEKQSYKSFFPQEFIELRLRILNYL